MIVLIIFLITAFILKLLKVVLNQVEAGRLQLPEFTLKPWAQPGS